MNKLFLRVFSFVVLFVIGILVVNASVISYYKIDEKGNIVSSDIKIIYSDDDLLLSNNKTPKFAIEGKKEIEDLPLEYSYHIDKDGNISFLEKKEFENIKKGIFEVESKKEPILKTENKEKIEIIENKEKEEIKKSIFVKQSLPGNIENSTNKTEQKESKIKKVEVKKVEVKKEKKVYRITQLPMKYGATGFYSFHEGIDYGIYYKDLYAPFDGNVVHAGYQYGFGNLIGIKNNTTGSYFILGHLNKINVKVGQDIKKGTLIGKTGNSG
ncbi:MAG: M23 family metallopeptidase, partial [Candidatus Gracilibacteria bacterium]|nr:M23 family metallopeptidase [Candidatus Gracilibacteria bacterium]